LSDTEKFWEALQNATSQNFSVDRIISMSDSKGRDKFAATWFVCIVERYPMQRIKTT
jgi:hypothetical protein